MSGHQDRIGPGARPVAIIQLAACWNRRTNRARKSRYGPSGRIGGGKGCPDHRRRQKPRWPALRSRCASGTRRSRAARSFATRKIAGEAGQVEACSQTRLCWTGSRAEDQLARSRESRANRWRSKSRPTRFIEANHTQPPYCSATSVSHARSARRRAAMSTANLSPRTRGRQPPAGGAVDIAIVYRTVQPLVPAHHVR